MTEQKRRKVNRILGAQARIGPFTLGQIIPAGVALWLAFAVKQLLGLTWIQFALFFLWKMGMITVFSGNRSWRFFNKFISPPRTLRARSNYSSPLDMEPSGKHNS